MGFSLRGVLPDDGLALIGKKFSLFRGGRGKIKWRPQGDLNPRRRSERAVSLAGLDDGDARSGEPSRSRTCDPLIKSQMLYQLSYGLPRKSSMVKAGKQECQARNGFFRRMVWFRSAPTEISETSTPASSSSLRTYFWAVFGSRPNSRASDRSSFHPSSSS